MATIELIKEALLALNDRDGSTVHAITKWIEANKQVTVKKHVMRAALKDGVENGILVKVKNSYKLVSPDEAKKKPKDDINKPKDNEGKLRGLVTSTTAGNNLAGNTPWKVLANNGLEKRYESLPLVLAAVVLAVMAFLAYRKKYNRKNGYTNVQGASLSI